VSALGIQRIPYTPKLDEPVPADFRGAIYLYQECSFELHVIVDQIYLRKIASANRASHIAQKPFAILDDN
jgi:hypothetical protein